MTRKQPKRKPRPGIDECGRTPLHFAAQARSFRVTEVLLTAGAEVEAQDRDGNTPLSTAVFNSLGDGSVIVLLRSAGASAYKANHHGITPLTLARTIANYDLARFFSDLP